MQGIIRVFALVFFDPIGGQKILIWKRPEIRKPFLRWFFMGFEALLPGFDSFGVLIGGQ